MPSWQKQICALSGLCGYILLRNLRNLRLKNSCHFVAKILRVFVVKFNKLCVLCVLCGYILRAGACPAVARATGSFSEGGCLSGKKP